LPEQSGKNTLECRRYWDEILAIFCEFAGYPTRVLGKLETMRLSRRGQDVAFCTRMNIPQPGNSTARMRLALSPE
jgi:hypothetical protein